MAAAAAAVVCLDVVVAAVALLGSLTTVDGHDVCHDETVQQ